MKLWLFHHFDGEPLSKNDEAETAAFAVNIIFAYLSVLRDIA